MSKLIRNIFKYGSLFMTVAFTSIAIGYSFIETGKTVEDVEHFVPDDVKDKDKYIPVKELDIKFDKNFDTYFENEIISYEAIIKPSKATNKKIIVDIPKDENGKPAFKVNFETREIQCLKSGNYDLSFGIEKEKVKQTKEINVQKLDHEIFDILNENNESVANTDLFFKPVLDAKPMDVYLNIKNKDILNRVSLTTDVSNEEICELKFVDDNHYQIVPLKNGTSSISFKIGNIDKKIHVTFDKINPNEGYSTQSILYYGVHSLCYIGLITPYSPILDKNNLIVEYEHPDLFKTYSLVNVKSMSKFQITVSSIKEKVNLVTKSFIEHITVKYKYPGGEIINLTEKPIEFQVHPGEPLKQEYFKNITPGETIELTSLINSNGEVYQDKYTKHFDILCPHPRDTYNYLNFEYEVISPNSIGLNLEESTYDELVVRIENRVLPGSYTIRYKFNKNTYDANDPSTFFDFNIKFNVYNSIPENEDCIFDFWNLYGPLDADPDTNVIPKNITSRWHLNYYGKSQTELYEIKRKDGSVSPIFNDYGIICEPANEDAKQFKIVKNKYNKTSRQSADYITFGSDTINNVDSNRMQCAPKFRFTSPVYEFFGVEPQWTEIGLIVDEIPFKYDVVTNLNNGTKNITTCTENYSEQFNLDPDDNLNISIHMKKSYYHFQDNKGLPNDSIKNRSSFDIDEIASMIVCKPFIETTNNDCIFINGDEFIAVAPGDADITLNLFKHNKSDIYNNKVNLKFNVSGDKPLCKTSDFNLDSDISSNNLNISINDDENGILRINNQFNFLPNNIDIKNLIDEFEVTPLNECIRKDDNFKFTPIKVGESGLIIKHKKYGVINKIVHLTITDSTSNFSVEKGNFESVSVDQKTGVIRIKVFSDKDYQLKIKTLKESTSKVYRIKNNDDAGLIEIKSNNVFRANKSGTTQIKVLYGDESLNEQVFEKLVDVEIINAGAFHANISYKTRKLLGHFGLFASLGFSAMCFLTIWLFDKKYRKLLPIPCSMIYSYFIAWLSEYIQGFVPGRCYAMSDVILNFEGALMGIFILFGGFLIYLLIAYILKKYKMKKIKSLEENPSKLS